MKIAAILAGGFGKRLQPVVKDLPKPLANVGTKPFLFFLLETLAQQRYTDVVMLTGYLHEKMIETCGDGQKFGLTITYSQESEPLGTAGAVKLAEPYLSKTQDFLLLNGDSFCPEAMIALSTFSPMPKVGLMAVSYVEDAARYGTVKFDSNSKKILAFQEKMPNTSGYVNAGVYRFTPKIFNYISPAQKLSLEDDIFPAIIAQNEEGLLACEIDAPFNDIGLPESYHEFIDLCQKGKFQ